MNPAAINILAIESSCDDTSAAVISNGHILSNCVANQVIHQKYGGVVPEVASREHLIHMVPVVEIAFQRANLQLADLSAIAFTIGPGLLGSLMVGVTFGKALALIRNIPIIEVHHMQAHILAHFIDAPQPEFPFLCLIASGGHTQIVIVRDYLDMEVIGQTRDDAAGEAFDKSGKLMGLTYPAGPEIDKYAKLGRPIYPFPEPSIPGLDFSFSGLKTAILYFLQAKIQDDAEFISKELSNICASVQHAIVEILIHKLEAAATQTGIKELAICGGVSANSELRNKFDIAGKSNGWNCYIPKFEYCTDNAAMIAMAAHYKYKAGLFAKQDVAPKARLEYSIRR